MGENENSERGLPESVNVDFQSEFGKPLIFFITAMCVISAVECFKYGFTNTFEDYGVVWHDDSGVIVVMCYVMAFLLAASAVAFPVLYFRHLKRSDVLKRITVDAKGITINGKRVTVTSDDSVKIVYQRPNRFFAAKIYVAAGGYKYLAGSANNSNCFIAVDKLKYVLEAYDIPVLMKEEQADV